MDRLFKNKKAEHLASLGRAYAAAGDRQLAMKTHWQAISTNVFNLKSTIKCLLTFVGR